MIFFYSKSGHFEIFNLLIQEYEKRNIDFINATDMMGMSLLHFAAMNKKPNNTEILRTLIQKGANVNAIAKDNTTPLDFAASTGNPNMVQLLLDSGAGYNINLKDSTGDTPIMYAAQGTGESNHDFQRFRFKYRNNIR